MKERQRRLAGVDERVPSLSAKVLTHGEISAHLAEVYGAEFSEQTISTITDPVMEGVAAWQGSPLDRAYPVVFIDCDSRRPGRQPPSSGCGPVAREARVPSTGSRFWLSSRRSGPRPSSFRCAGRQDRGQDRESTEARPYRADRKRGHQPVPRAHTRRSSGCGRTPGLSSSRSCSSTPRSAGSSARPTPWLFEVPRGRSGRLGFGAGEQFGRCGRGRGGAGWLRQGPGCGLCSSTGEPMTSHHGAGESTCPFRLIWTPSRARPV